MFVRVGAAELARTDSALVPSVVFWSQTICASVYLPLAMLVLLLVPGADPGLVQWGLGLVVTAWLASVLLPWHVVTAGWQRTLPLINILAILVFAAALPGAGLEWLLPIPTIWLASLGGRGRTWLAPLLATAVFWPVMVLQAGWPEHEISDTQLALGLLLPAVLSFITGTIDATMRRAAAPQLLLERQGAWTEAALARVRQERERFRETLDSVRFSVVRVAVNGELVMQNNATRRLAHDLGLSDRTALAGLPLYEEDGVTTMSAESSPFRRAIRGEEVDRHVLWIGHPGQIRFAYEVTARRQDDLDAGDSVLIVSRDVTSEIEAVRARDDLVASLSHELRTPLQSISGFLELAREAPELSSQTHHLLEVAMGGVERMQGLVTDMLYAHTRKPNQAVLLHLADCNLTALARDAVTAMGVIANERLIGLHLQSRLSDTVRADSVRLRQVVDILLSNAIKYTDSGGRVEVLVGRVRGDGRDLAEVVVADTGRGMTEREQEGLFQPFYRAESVRSSKVHGTGLGLSIARDIVEQHDGEISLTSIAGEGTRVVVRLPIAGPEEAS